MEIEVRRIDGLDLDPLAVYARLRRCTPGRGSYLLESRAHDSAAGRHSIVGYRVRQRSLMPPGVDAVRAQGDSLEPQTAPASFAAAMALATVGYLSPAGTHARHKLPLFRDEGPSAQLMVGAVVVVFDHHEGNVFVAGPREGALVDRCLSEMAADGGALDLSATDAAGEPGEVQALLNDDALSGRAARAKPYFGDELASLVLAQSYFVPLADVDLLDVYCALRTTPHVTHGYYVDFGSVPYAPDTRIAGVARHTLHLRRRDAEGQSIRDAFETPHPSTLGEPPLTAHRVLRKLENAARPVWGGAVGYLCPGGESAFVLADDIISAESGQIAVNVGAEVSADTDPAGLPRAARAAAARALGAVRRAQELAKQRVTT